jgi:hypothetical protein
VWCGTTVKTCGARKKPLEFTNLRPGGKNLPLEFTNLRAANLTEPADESGGNLRICGRAGGKPAARIYEPANLTGRKTCESDRAENLGDLAIWCFFFLLSLQTLGLFPVDTLFKDASVSPL